MAGGLIDELFVALGFKIDDKGLKQLDKNMSMFMKRVGQIAEKMGKKVDWEALAEVDKKIQNTIASISRFTVAFTAAIVVLDRMATSLLKNNQAFISFNQQTGLAISNINRMAQAGMLANMNITPETVMQSMQAVQSNLAQIRLGEGNIAPFQLLGISPIGKDANQIFDELRQAISGLDDMTATNIIQQMGFSPEMITVLRMTNAELEDMNGLMLSPEQRQAMQQYGMALRKVHMEFALLKDQALIAIMPVLIDFLKGFKAIAQVTYDMMDGFGKLLDMIPQLKGALAALALGILAYFNPVIAAVTALYLLIEDLAVWKAGGKSAIGTLVGDVQPNAMPYKTVRDLGQSHGQSIADWLLNQMGLEGSSSQINALNNALSMGASGTAAQISNAQNMTQNNYMAFGSADAVPIAQKANDLMFAMMQVDRTA